MLFSSEFHSELFAIQFIFRGNFLTLDAFISCSNLRELGDYENDEIDNKSKKRRPQSGFEVVIKSADLFPKHDRSPLLYRRGQQCSDRKAVPCRHPIYL